MKRHFAMTVLACCCLALLAVHFNLPAPDTRVTDEAATRDASKAWIKVDNAGDAGSLDALYTPS